MKNHYARRGYVPADGKEFDHESHDLLKKAQKGLIKK